MQVSEIPETDMFRYLERGYWPYEFRSPLTAHGFSLFMKNKGIVSIEWLKTEAISYKPLVEVVI